jgi:hypothetical protein
MRFFILLVVFAICNASVASDLNIYVEKKLKIEKEKNKIIAVARSKNISNESIYILKYRPNIYIYLNDSPIDFIGVIYKKSEPSIDQGGIVLC